MLLNYVRLQPGEALYLGAGVPHAYLDGIGVEIMANSDNVLRCGLTPKHIDVPELLRVVRFEAGDAGVLRPETAPDGDDLYPAPLDEFRLSRYLLTPGADARILDAATPQILLCTNGEAQLRAGDGDTVTVLTLARGESAYIPAGEPTCMTGQGTVFRATVAA
jgi:mannose-6-phosphate isomerase